MLPSFTLAFTNMLKFNSQAFLKGMLFDSEESLRHNGQSYITAAGNEAIEVFASSSLCTAATSTS